MSETTECTIPIWNENEIIAYAKCSKIDYDKITKFKWRVCKDGYPFTTIDRTPIKLHHYVKYVLENKQKDDLFVVDHVDNDKLDVRREMLQLKNKTQSSRNRKKREHTSSNYRGVHYNKRDNVFTATICLNKKKIHIGSDTDEVSCARIYDAYLLKHVDNLDQSGFKLNFPNEREESLKFYKVVEKKPSETSQFKYVHFHKAAKSFQATIRLNSVHYQIAYGTEQECAIAADDYIVKNKLKRELNFPDRHPGYNDWARTKTEKEDIDENTIRLIIPSCPDAKIIIDREHYEKVRFRRLAFSNGYIIMDDNTRFHRFLMEEENPRVVIDHINGDPLDNRLCNLRRTTFKGNNQNRRKRKDALSFWGISKSSKKFKAWVKLEDGSKKTKTFTEKEHAARWRDLFILSHMPNSLYPLNFEWDHETIDHWTEQLMK